jgi:hypothetical protein
MNNKFYTVGGTVTTKEVEGMVRLCMKHLSKKEYELRIGKETIQYALDILKVCHVKAEGATHGGSKSIKINLAHWQFQKGIQTCREYKAFNKDKHIGEIQTYNYHQSLLLVVSHEVAHHVQHKQGSSIPRYRNTWQKAHGLCFQDIYRMLRKDLINPMCTADGFYSDIDVPQEQEPIKKKRSSPKQRLIALCEKYDWLEYDYEGWDFFRVEVWDNRPAEMDDAAYDQMLDHSHSWKEAESYALKLIKREV